MTAGGAQPLAPWRWLGVPILQVAAASLLFALPMRFWGLGLPEPLFAMPVTFAWAVIRPSMLAPVGVMLMGLFLDLLWGARIGFWPVCLLLPYGLVLGGRAMLVGLVRRRHRPGAGGRVPLHHAQHPEHAGSPFGRLAVPGDGGALSVRQSPDRKVRGCGREVPLSR
jgi:hypothetical protein